MVKVAIIGFGGIVHSTHLKAHMNLVAKGATKLVAVCDVCPEKFEEKFEINIGGENVELSADVKKYTDWREMLEKEDIDMVDVCVPTFLHAEIAIGALESGHHVLCEKPMSLTYDTCLKMCDAAKKSGKKLMIGQCGRFGAPYLYIKKLIDEKTYGEVKSAVFQRLSPPPVWGWDNWYMDTDRSGGCALDLHIHDIDYCRFVFGNPEKVSCTTSGKYSEIDIAHSRLMYKDFSVMAIGDWSRENVPFELRCSIAFENATLTRLGPDIKIYPRGGEAFDAEYEPNDMYQAEIEHLVECIENDKVVSNVPEDSALSVKLVNALVESANNNGEFVPFIVG